MQIATSNPLPIPPSLPGAGVVSGSPRPAGTGDGVRAQTTSSVRQPVAGAPVAAATRNGDPRRVVPAPAQAPAGVISAAQGGVERNLLSALLGQMGGGGARTQGRIIDTFV